MGRNHQNKRSTPPNMGKALPMQSGTRNESKRRCRLLPRPRNDATPTRQKHQEVVARRRKHVPRQKRRNNIDTHSSPRTQKEETLNSNQPKTSTDKTKYRPNGRQPPERGGKPPNKQMQHKQDGEPSPIKRSKRPSIRQETATNQQRGG